jgi:hypothetical protein
MSTKGVATFIAIAILAIGSAKLVSMALIENIDLLAAKEAKTERPESRYVIWCHFKGNREERKYVTKRYNFYKNLLTFTVDNQDGRKMAITNPSCRISQV